MRRRISRRDFLKLGGAGAAGVALLGSSACTGGMGSVVRSDATGEEMNVILVIVDSLRKDAVGSYGGEWVRTPNIDALTAGSLRFDNFWPESVPTIPARRSIHTGLRSFPFRGWEYEPGDVRVYGWEPIPDGQRTVSEVLYESGFETALVTDTRHQFEPHMNFVERFNMTRLIKGQEWAEYRARWRADEERVQGYLLDEYRGTHVEDKIRQYVANTDGRREKEEDWFAPATFIEAMDALEELKESRPFFLTVDVFDPHEPWDPPDKYVALYDDVEYDGPEPITAKYGDASYLEERELERMKALYAAEATMFDRWFGEFLGKVDELGLAEDSLLIFVSDHGFAFAEHGVVGKVSSRMFPELMDIPFLIRHPEGKGAGGTTGYYAAFHDIPATIVDALGFETEEPLEGASLAPLLEGRRPAQKRSHLVSGYDRFVWTRDDDYVLMAENNGDGATLFDLNADPDQHNDISADNPQVVKRLFDRILDEAGGPMPRYDV